MALTTEEQADLDAAEYFKQNSPGGAEGKNMFANIPMGSPANTEEQTENKQPSWLKPAGAATGAYIAYKGLGTGFFNPSTDLFRPITVQPKPFPTQAPRAGLPSANVNAPTEGGLPVETQPVIQDAHVQQRTRANEIAEIEKKIRDDANAKRRPPGEMEHNAEQNRIRLTTEQNLGQSGAKGQIVGAGSMRWDPVTQTFVPPSVIDERTKQQATTEWETNKKASEDAQAKKDADAAEKKRVDDAVQAKKDADAKAAEHKIEAHEAEERFKKLSEAEAAGKGKVLGGLRGGLNLASGIVGGKEAAKNFYDAYEEYKKKGFSDEMIDHMIQGGANLAMAVPSSISQMGGNAVAFYQEMKKNGLSDQAISHALMGAGAGAMMYPTPATMIGGGLTAAAGMAYPYVAPGVRHLTGKFTDPEHNKEADIATRSTP